MDAFYKEDLDKSAIAKHLKDESHDPHRITTTLIHHDPKGSALNRLEEFEVIKEAHRSPDLLLNYIQYTCTDAFLSFLFKNN